MLLDGYIRVSQVGGRRGDRFISPSVQREEIEAWTSSHNAVLGEVFEELDESGGRADRPLLTQAIERVEEGQSDGLIVAKLDRFGRSVIDGLRSIARIEGAGGTFISVQDGVDLSTPTGKLVMRILFSIGEWELERMRSSWDAARARAIERGVYIGRKGPIGYRHDENRRLVVVPEEAAVIREVFERRQLGESMAKIAAFLNESAVETESGVPFESVHISKMISNAAYKGEAHSGIHTNPSAHEPIVDAATWQECQSLPREPFSWVKGLLSGRIRCASCGKMMIGLREPGRSIANYYHCTGDRGKCPSPAHARTDFLDPLVEEFVFGLCRRRRASGSESRVRRCEDQVEKAKADLASYRDNPRLLRTLGLDSFEEGLATRQRRIERALLELARARKAVRRPTVDPGNLEERWPAMSWEERCAVVGQFIDVVVVERGLNALIERSWVFKRGQGPIVRSGNRSTEKFDPEIKRAGRLAPLEPWPRGRIERELRAFMSGREEWPRYAEFADAGRARLYAQVMAWGGPHYWGHMLGIRVARGTVHWNETLLRDALAPFLEGRKSWPNSAEFRAAGMGTVYSAARNHGGYAHWAGEFGLEYNGQARTWPKERIERELVEFTAECERFPTAAEFERAGREKLHGAVMRHGGAPYWAERLGLKLARSSLESRECRVRRG